MAVNRRQFIKYAGLSLLGLAACPSTLLSHSRPLVKPRSSNIGPLSEGKIGQIDRFTLYESNIPDSWANEAAQHMVDQIDKDLLNTVILKSRQHGTSTLTKEIYMQHIQELGKVLDEQNTPESDRYVVVPPWMKKHVTQWSTREAPSKWYEFAGFKLNKPVKSMILSTGV